MVSLGLETVLAGTPSNICKTKVGRAAGGLAVLGLAAPNFRLN